MPLPAVRRLAAVTVLLGASVCAAIAPAAGAPIDDKRAQAAEIEAQINENAVQLSILNEQVMGAQAEYDTAAAELADAEASIAAARAETRRLERLVRQRAASVYRSSSSGTIPGLFDPQAGTMSAREQYAEAASAHDDALLDRLDAAREDLAIRRRDAKAARETAQHKRDSLFAVQANFAAAQAEREAIYAGLNAEIAAMVAEEQAKRAAAEAPDFDPGSLPPPSGDTGTVVAYAQAQLGKPYCYAGTGPDCFDCSGLTLSAWAQVGVAMSHSDSAQYNSFPHVPMDQLAPGDLVWKPGHIGIYVGGGVAIHATKPGDVVRYISVSYFQAAARPG
jgi:cell wall-associated NlpC family hydrolase